MSAPRTPGLLTDDEVADIRALRSVSSSRRLVEYVEKVVASHRAAAWDEGYKAGGEDETDAYWSGPSHVEPNPYKEES